MNDESRLGAMDPYGMRAMRYVRDHCPARYEMIVDPLSFFSTLGAQLRDEVLALEPTLGEPAPPLETWDQALGRRNMARLAAEETIFAELCQAMPPEDEEADSAAWEPLMPDMADIARAEAEGI